MGSRRGLRKAESRFSSSSAGQATKTLTPPCHFNGFDYVLRRACGRALGQDDIAPDGVIDSLLVLKLPQGVWRRTGPASAPQPAREERGQQCKCEHERERAKHRHKRTKMRGFSA
jgi:hypothetical protein